MKDDIRRQTYIIIRKNGRYLVGRSSIDNTLKWSWSVYEAWRTRDREKAEEIARATGGIMVLFNPIVNQRRVIGT
jgi:hypothetical protein